MHKRIYQGHTISEVNSQVSLLEVDMKKSKFFSGAQKEKASIIAASVFVLSALTLTGVYFTAKDEPPQENKIDFAKNDEIHQIKPEEKQIDRSMAKVESIPENRYVNTKENNDLDRELSYTEVISGEVKNEEENQEVVNNQVGNGSPKVYHFGADARLQWPVVGKVLLNYSMDQAIFFETMQQYRYNPSVVIAAKEGETITAAAEGVVKAVSKEQTTGNTVCVSLGDGYELTYGQLADVKLKAGDEVKVGDYIGKVAAPTIYYSKEGSNVYFALTKDGEPQDPFHYFEE